MHYLIHTFLNFFTDVSSMDTITYIGIATLTGMGIVLLFVYILFAILISFVKSKQASEFEHKLKRRRMWAWIYVFVCFWLSAEIIACWQFSWLTHMNDYIPLWFVFVFSAVMSLVHAFVWRRRGAELRSMDKKMMKIRS